MHERETKWNFKYVVNDSGIENQIAVIEANLCAFRKCNWHINFNLKFMYELSYSFIHLLFYYFKYHQQHPLMERTLKVFVCLFRI